MEGKVGKNPSHTGGRYEVGCERRDDGRAHDHGEKSKELSMFALLLFQALCMNELKGCQKFSMGPNFIYFGAQK